MQARSRKPGVVLWLLLLGVLGASVGCLRAAALAVEGAGNIAEQRAKEKKQAEEARRLRYARPPPSVQEVGPRTEDIEAVELSTADGTATYCQGGKPPLLDLKLVTAQRTYEGRYGRTGSRLFERLQWSASFGRITEAGQWQPPVGSPGELEQPVVITASVAGKSEISTRLTLAPDFKCERMADFRGVRGQSGERGATGAPGQDGSSSQPEGGRGGNGGPGGPGGQGGDALPVEVALASVRHPRHGDRVLVRVQQVGTKKRAYYLVDSVQRVTVGVSGGQGGAGGWGGDGGPGGEGYSVDTVSPCCNGNGGDGGDGGPGGNGGQGGNGGAVIVKLSRKDAALQEHLRIVSAPGLEGEGGDGGSGGPAGLGGLSSQRAQGKDGREGGSGAQGTPGQPGAAGPAPQFVIENGSPLSREDLPPEWDLVP